MTKPDSSSYQVGIQSNSGGDITINGGSLNIAGRDVNLGAVQDKQEFILQLEQIKEAIVRAGETQIIKEEAAIDAEAAVKKAIGQAKKPTPNKQHIVNYLDAAKSLLQGITGASGLVVSVAAAIDAVHKLFS